MPEKRRLMFLQRCYDPEMTASGEMLRQLAEFLVERNWTVDVVCAGSQQAAVHEVKPGLEIHRTRLIPYWRRSTLARFFSMQRISQAIFSRAKQCRRPDIIISLTDPPGLILLGEKVARHFRSRHVHWSQDVYPEIAERLGIVSSSNPYIRHLKRASARAMQRSERVVSIGFCMTRVLLERGVPAEKIVTIPNWADPALNVEIGADRSRAHKWDLPADHVVLYSGNLGLAHEFATVVDGAEILACKEIPWTFVFVGDGQRRAELETSVRARGLSNIRFFNRLSAPDYAELLRYADLQLVTVEAKVEGCMVPSKAYAAWAAGSPILYIGPERNDIHDVIVRTQSGLSIRNGNHQDLADALEELYRQPSAQEDMAAGAVLAANEFSLAKSGACFSAILESLL